MRSWMIAFVLFVSACSPSPAEEVVEPVGGEMATSVTPTAPTTTTTTTLPPITVQADVVVIGDSLAGWAAALAASREGADTILIDIDDSPRTIGGQGVEGGVPSWDGHIFRGIDRELRERIGALYRDANVSLTACYGSWWDTRDSEGEWRVELVEFDLTAFAYGKFCPHTEVLNDVLWKMLEESNVYVAHAPDVTWVDGLLVSAASRTTFDAEMYVGATETGAMIPETVRREIPVECRQDTTQVFTLSEPSPFDDNQTVSAYADSVEPDAAWQAFWEDAKDDSSATSPTGKDWSAWWTVADGQGPPLTDLLALYRRTTDLDGRVHTLVNWGNDAPTIEESVFRGEQLILSLTDTYYADWHVSWSSENYQRTSLYRLNGTVHMESAPRGELVNGVMTGADSWPDSIGLGGNYYADFHGDEDQCEGTLDSEPFGSYDVPAGIFLPEERMNFLVAMPRSADVSHVVASSIRMQPPEVELGWSVGVWAAMAAELGVVPHDIDIDELRQRKLGSDTHSPLVDLYCENPDTCATPPAETPVPTTASSVATGPVTPQVWRDSVEQWRPMVSDAIAAWGGPSTDVDRFLRVMQCESGGDPYAKNPNSSASGLMQHLSRFWDDRAVSAGIPGGDIFDGWNNIYVSAWLLYAAPGGGWAHWVCR